MTQSASGRQGALGCRPCPGSGLTQSRSPVVPELRGRSQRPIVHPIFKPAFCLSQLKFGDRSQELVPPNSELPSPTLLCPRHFAAPRPFMRREPRKALAKANARQASPVLEIPRHLCPGKMRNAMAETACSPRPAHSRSGLNVCSYIRFAIAGQYNSIDGWGAGGGGAPGRSNQTSRGHSGLWSDPGAMNVRRRRSAAQRRSLGLRISLQVMPLVAE